MKFLVVADVDGTLLDTTCSVTEAVRGVVQAAKDRGALFTIATGRILPSAAAVASAAGIDCPIIAGGGAAIGTPGGLAISRTYLGRSAALRVLSIVGKGEYRYAFVDDRLLTDTPGKHVETYSRAIGVPVEVVDNLEVEVGENTTHVVLRVDPAKAESLVREYRPLVSGIASVMRTLPHLVEFVNPTVSKGSALRTLCGMLGVPVSSAIAVGDSESDMDMLEVAGKGVLVANAPPELRSRARYVTVRPYTDGVMEAIERFVPEA